MIRLLLNGYKPRDLAELHYALHYALCELAKIHEEKFGPDTFSQAGQDLKQAFDYITDVLQKVDNT